MGIQNISDLRKQLVESFEILKKDPRTINQAGELANTAGKIIGTIKIEIEYAHLRKVRPKIDFLEYN